MKDNYKIENRLFRLEFRKRKTPNEFTEAHDAVENFKTELFKAFKIPEIVEWLNKKLKQDEKI